MFDGTPSLEKIGAGAFGDSGLRHFVAPRSLKKIEFRAFFRCSRLESADLSQAKGLTTLEPDTFMQCQKLRSVTLPDGLRTIGRGCFSGTGLETIRIPRSVREIDEYAFCNCGKLAELVLEQGNALRQVQESAFEGTLLTEDSVRFPSKTWVSEAAFENIPEPQEGGPV